MHKPVVAVVLSVMAVALLASPGVARLEKAEMTTAAVIDDAFSRGFISHDEMILQKAYALYAPWKLREELVGGRIDKCGVPMADEIFQALPDLPGEIADEIRDLRARPSNMTYIDTDHFRIHYDTSGTDMIKNWPNTAYRDAIMAAAEYSWDVEVTAMGFRSPPPDGSDPDGGGGNDKYDVYVQNLGTGLYGYCQPTYYYGGGGYPANAATSYIVIDNDYAGFPHTAEECAQITVAHEFCHGIQAAHDVNEPTWYKECTSVWAEEQVYDSVNDYISYLSSFLSSLYRSVDYHDGNFRWYGSCVWNFFLSEYYDPGIVVDNWYQMESSGQTFDMMNVVLATYGSSMEEAYKNFAIWTWFTGSRNDGTHYEEGGTWPAASIMRGHNTYPIAVGGPTPTWEPDHYGCNYIQFNNPGSGYDGLLVSYDGPQLLTVANAAYVNYKDSSGHYYEYGEIPLNPWGVGELTVEGWDGMQFAGLVVINNDDGANDMDYTYNAEPVETGVADGVYSFGLKAASPNPFAETTSIAYSVPTGGGFVDIAIYDVNGREVRNLVSRSMEAGAGNAVWDGLDNAGQHVASGVYFARLDIDGLTASGKLIVLK
ncbi:MAG: T9SS type A sorting domain-containing protein [Candidatus Eisenbacteria bacterium]|nr:T9SS type A sorting domain-containing protein [Candidatus Eisenbacteria bacterium]